MNIPDTLNTIDHIKEDFQEAADRLAALGDELMEAQRISKSWKAQFENASKDRSKGWGEIGQLRQAVQSLERELKEQDATIGHYNVRMIDAERDLAELRQSMQAEEGET